MIRRGEIYFVDLDPIRGREQAGRRPVLVLSIDAINRLPLVVTVVIGTIGREPYPRLPDQRPPLTGGNRPLHGNGLPGFSGPFTRFASLPREGFWKRGSQSSDTSRERCSILSWLPIEERRTTRTSRALVLRRVSPCLYRRAILRVARARLGGAHQGDDGGLKSHHPL